EALRQKAIEPILISRCGHRRRPQRQRARALVATARQDLRGQCDDENRKKSAFHESSRRGRQFFHAAFGCSKRANRAPTAVSPRSRPSLALKNSIEFVA